MTPGALAMQRFFAAFHVLVLTALAAGPAGATVHTPHNPVLDSSGNVSAHMTYGPDGLVSRRSGSATTYYAFDAHGSVALTLDANGDAVSKHGWDAYGTSLGTAPSGPFGYGAQWGYYTDSETGLCALAFRAYDPATGRFLTRDPIGYAGGVNLYGYVGNGPASGVDPWGLQAPSSPQNPPGYLQQWQMAIEEMIANGTPLRATYAWTSALAWRTHHIFPQQFRDRFSNIFGDPKIIDSMCLRVPDWAHYYLHYQVNWNPRWEAFLKARPNATTNDVLYLVSHLLREAGLGDIRFVDLIKYR